MISGAAWFAAISEKQKKGIAFSGARFLIFGAEGGTRTRTDCSTRPSNVRGYQLRHLGRRVIDKA